jgi:hypothetical protein
MPLRSAPAGEQASSLPQGCPAPPHCIKPKATYVSGRLSRRGYRLGRALADNRALLAPPAPACASDSLESSPLPLPVPVTWLA